MIGQVISLLIILWLVIFMVYAVSNANAYNTGTQLGFKTEFNRSSNLNAAAKYATINVIIFAAILLTFIAITR